MHPEGRPYFCSEELENALWRFLTYEDLSTSSTYDRIQTYRSHLQDGICRHAEELTFHFHVVIHHDGCNFRYYMIKTDPKSRCLFWLHDVKAFATPPRLSAYLLRLHLFHSLFDDRALHGFPMLASLHAFPTFHRNTILQR